MQRVTVCLWVNGQYEDAVYQGKTPLQSTVIPDFALVRLRFWPNAKISAKKLSGFGSKAEFE